MSRTHFVALIAGLAFACGLAQAASAGTLRAGAGKVSITSTPDQFPAQMLREKPFVGVHDDVFARALVLDDGRRRIVIVSLEVTTVPHPEQIVKAVAEAAQVAPANVMVTATHTHNVPLAFYHGQEVTPMLQKELDRVEAGAVQATRDAVAHLQAARMASARGKAFVNTNNGEQAGLEGWYDAAGYSDKTLDVVRVVGVDGAPIAVMLNYATHGEVMFRSVTKDGGYEVSGDLPGAVSRILETQPNGAPVAIFTSAAEGDQLPLFKSLQPDAELKGTDQGVAGWGILDLQARRLASAALVALQGAPAGNADATIGTAAGAVICPGQKFQRDRATGTVTLVDTAPVTIPVSVIRIDDLAFAGIAADIASDIGSAIKSHSPLPKTTVVTMLAGSVGYVLNDASYVKPGHGAMGSPVKPGCAPKALPAEVARLLRSTGR